MQNYLKYTNKTSGTFFPGYVYFMIFEHKSFTR